MFNFPVYLIIPHDYYTFGNYAVIDHVDETMSKYDMNNPIEKIVVMKYEELLEEYEDYKDEYDLKTFCRKIYGLELDENNNGTEIGNPHGIFDWFEIGGKFDNVFSFNELYENLYTTGHISRSSISVKNFNIEYNKNED